MRLPLLAYLLLTLFACGQAKDNLHKPLVGYKPDTLKKGSHAIQNNDMPVFENAHANAKRVMTEKFYFSTNDETAPFGNSDGAGTYAAFKDWRKTHKSNEPKEFLSRHIDQWTYPKFDLEETDIEKLKPYLMERELGSRFIAGIDAAIIATAFGQLYLEGTIDQDFKETTKTAIKRQLIPELLAFWGDPYKKERAAKLNKMLEALHRVK